MHTNPEEKTSCTTQYQQAFLDYGENKYCAKHRQLSIIKPENILSSDLFRSAKASGSGQSSFDQYDLSSNNEECLMPNNLAETTPGHSNHAAR